MKSWNQRFGLILVASLLSAPLMAGKHDHDHYGHDHDKRHHDAHVHGMAKLQMAIEGKQVLIELETPAANVVGFEHAPHNAEQKQKVAKAVKILQDYRNLLVLKGGDCVQKNADVESPFYADEHDHPQKGDKEEKTHSDFKVGYELNCNSANNIQTVELSVFKHFPGFEKIKLEWVAEGGQGAAEASVNGAVIKIQ